MIEQLLKEIKEDKIDNLSTTSFKFKRDVWDYFQGYTDKVAVEFGTHKGQTTRVLSFLFDKVYTINNNDNASAKLLNQDRSNIIYIDNFDLYSNRVLPINDTVSVFLIDAGHTYQQVVSDINRVSLLSCSEDCYIIFDDYGLAQYELDVKKAVNEAIDINALRVIKGIGHEAGFNFGGTPSRVLNDNEGLITKVIWH